MKSSHVFKDVDGNEFHLGSSVRKTGPHIGGKVFSLPLDQIADGSIEAGLLCLSLWLCRHPGVTLTRREIAYVCGCSDSLIYALEQTALKRIRKFHSRLLIDHTKGLASA